MPAARRRRALPLLVLTVAVLAFGWWATELRPFTWPSLITVESAGLAAVAVGAWRSRPRRRVRAGQPEPAPGSGAGRWPAGLEAWVVLVVLLAAWELAAYVQHPRDEHPTLSSLVDGVLAFQPLRVVAFAGWLAGAYGLARR